MRAIAFIAIVALSATQAMAIERIRSDQLTCQQVTQSVAQNGAIIIRYPSPRGTGVILYDRYVADDSQCVREKEAVRATVPATDNPQCAVMRCEEVEPIWETLFGD